MNESFEKANYEAKIPELSFLSRNVTSEDPNSTYTKEKISKLIADYHDGRSSCFFSGTTWLILPITHKSRLIKIWKRGFSNFGKLGALLAHGFQNRKGIYRKKLVDLRRSYENIRTLPLDRIFFEVSSIGDIPKKKTRGGL